MSASWDRRPPAQLVKKQQAALRAQVVDAVAPFSPFWRARLAALGRSAASVTTLSGLASLPAAGERDVSPDGDPAGVAGLVLQAGESGFALHSDGPTLRKALTRRLVVPGSYRAIVENDTRPTSYVWAGLGMRFPLASTRSDLDVVARAGARLWQVLGLTRADVVVSALPTLPTATTQALQLGALGAGAPLLAPGERTESVAAALALVPASVLVLPSLGGGALLRTLAEGGAPLATVRTVLVAPAPYDDEREDVRAALASTDAKDAVVLGVHVPDGHRLVWGECRPSGGSTGLHSYPDLEVVEGVDPETGERPGGDGPQEVVVTQLGMRGSALLRWRTGDLADAVSSGSCPACGRTVPRVVGLRRAALVPELALRTGAAPVDLRAVASAVRGRTDVRDWRVVLGRSARDDADELLVHVVPSDGVDASDVAVGVARDLRVACGLLPTQVVVAEPGELPAGEPLTAHVLG
jgi:phenylacetate-coenzyme A ligase PaaK-like adenylate-forming protein